jgi:hypothetical protein
MVAEPIHSRPIDDEDMEVGDDDDVDEDDEDDEDEDDETGSDEDASSLDDFEFKDLEKEIYGRLGGPPPELALAIDEIPKVEQKVVRKASGNLSKPTKTPLEKKSSRGSGSPLQDVTSLKGNQNVADVAPAPSTSAPLSKPVVGDAPTFPTAKNEHSVKVEAAKENEMVPQKSDKHNKVEQAKNGDESEAPMDDCGCIVM